MSVFHTTTASKLMASGLEAEHCKYFQQLTTFHWVPISIVLSILFAFSHALLLPQNAGRSLHLSGFVWQSIKMWLFLKVRWYFHSSKSFSSIFFAVLGRLIYRGFTALPLYIFGKYYLQWVWGYEGKSWPVFQQYFATPMIRYTNSVSLNEHILTDWLKCESQRTS